MYRSICIKAHISVNPLVAMEPKKRDASELLLSLLPVGFVLLWPWLRVLLGEINAIEAFFDWYHPWLGVRVRLRVTLRVTVRVRDGHSNPTLTLNLTLTWPGWPHSYPAAGTCRPAPARRPGTW